MQESDFLAGDENYVFSEKSGKVSWQSPSNLAIIKYWGKYGNQLPRNPSLSITLSKAVTQTAINYSFERRRKKSSLNFLFHGQENRAFSQRISRFLSALIPYFPFIRQTAFSISSENSFPHSSGIASSASGMSALALCLCSIENQLKQSEEHALESSFFWKASFIARLGSGSACRSVFPSFAFWGETPHYKDSSDLHAIGIENYSKIYDGLRNDILIISKSEKTVSSSEGHRLMTSNTYAKARYRQAFNRIEELAPILRSGDLHDFGKLLESEALTLHALMMTSDPSYLLLEPNTIRVLSTIRAFRRDTGIPVFFSLDAGPNVHIISFEKDKHEMPSLLSELMPYSENGMIISDSIGIGPVPLL